MRILLAILIIVGFSLAPAALADSSVAAYSDFTYGTPSPVVDEDNDPNGYFDFTYGTPSVAYEFVEAAAPPATSTPTTRRILIIE